MTVFEITNVTEHDSLIHNNQRLVIFFGSNRCGHCKSIAPVFANLAAANPHIAFAHVEVSRIKTENVDGVPVFVGYKDGQPVDTVIGADDEGIIALIRQLM